MDVSSGSAGGIRVLVADDSEEFVAGLRAWIAAQPGLELAGAARDGAQALAVLDDARPDLVLMDAVMPGLDGFAATRAIRSRTGAPPVVILSLHDSQAVREAARSAGAEGFVAKSELAERLLPMIRKLVPQEAFGREVDR